MALTPQDWKAIVAAVIVLGGANIGNLWNAADPRARADPFTGTDGKHLETKLHNEIERMIDRHEAAILRRISRNEAIASKNSDRLDQALRNDAACREGLISLKERCQRFERQTER